MSMRWQYRVVEIKVHLFGDSMSERAQAELDKLGAQGWELVSTTHSHATDMLRLFLKRPA